MPVYLASVHVMLRPVVNDPQGLTVAAGLRSLGFDTVVETRVGKRIDVTFEAEGEPGARDLVDQMCRRLLANPVIEDYTFTLTGATRERAPEPVSTPGAPPAP
ncbi:MAG: phosphoribosylformylglycinamidine synthase subunit PurS [Candidatus Dormibacteria bacterium]